MDYSKNRVVRLDKKSLKRVLGTADLFAVGYGDVGSSIYYALGATALYALGATPLALLVAGAVFLCTALTYAELSSTYPEPGGSTTFTRYACNDLVSFIAGWGLLLDYIVTVAISSFAIPPYLRHILSMWHITYEHTPFVHCAATIAIIVCLFVINIFGVKYSGRLSLMLAIFTILTQAGIVILGALLFLNLPYVIDHLRINVAGASWSPDWIQFAKGCAMAMVAYTGIEAIAQLAAETKRPAVAIPRAIKWTALVVIFLYMGISSIGLSVISPEELGTRYLEDPVGGIAVNFPIGGEFLGPWVGLIAAVVLLIAANAGLIGCSRLSFSMGEHYQLPDFFYKIHSRFRTPYVSLAIFTVLSALVIIASRGRMLFLADLYNFGAQIAFFSVHISLLILRWKKPNLERPYRVPLNIYFGKNRYLPVTAILGAIATLAVWIVVVVTKPEGRILGFLWMFLGCLFYFFYRRKKQLQLTGNLAIEKIKIPAYHPIHIKHILLAVRSLGGTDFLQTAFQLASFHKAQVTAVYVLEVPHSIPINGPIEEKEKLGELALKRAEAISREFHLSIHLEILRARSIEAALSKLMDGPDYDLLIVGAEWKELHRRDGFASQVDKLLKNSRCRVLFCRS
jgi:APA family basic amino acid/polyamine antiporter